MNKSSSKKRRSANTVFTAVIAVLLVIALTTSFLSARVVSLAYAKEVDEIELQPDTVGDKGKVSPTVEKEEYTVMDAAVVWENGEVTQVDIFATEYANDEGEMTVVSADGEKVIAPGTSGEYNFKICNTGAWVLQCGVYMEAVFGNAEYRIPVEVKATNYNGQYLVGSESEWQKINGQKEVFAADEELLLYPGYYMGYTLSWQWPFSESAEADAYDTLLGNIAAGMEDESGITAEDLTLTINIYTYAECVHDTTHDNDIVIDAAVEPTCTESGWTEGSHCAVCGEVIVPQEEIPPTGHTPGEKEYLEDTYVAPTEKENGSIDWQIRCTVCGEILEEGTEIIPATGEHEHNLEYVPAVEPTDTEDGHEEYWYCPDCDTYFTDPEGLNPVDPSTLVIPAGSNSHHHNMIWVEPTEPTADSDGNIGYWYCPDCDKYFLDEEGTQEISLEDTIIPAGTGIESTTEEENEENEETAGASGSTGSTGATGSTQGGIPNTSDDFQLGIYMGIAALSLLLIVALIVIKIREDRKRKAAREAE